MIILALDMIGVQKQKFKKRSIFIPKIGPKNQEWA